jgi:23S rRNA pseudouridine1911/1915/1917 synthase
VATDARHLVRAGDTLEFSLNARRPEHGLLGRDALVHVDPHVVVVKKPAGLSTVPYEDERDTLDQRVRGLLGRGKSGGPGAPLGVVQRLDKETSGLIVFARTVPAKRHLQQQFRVHSVERRYWALALGRVRAATFASRLVADRGDGRRGSTDNPRLGREAVTHVRPLEVFEDVTLLECRLETGRTHQIRIHLAEAGHPLLGERVYTREPVFALPALGIQVPRLMLHALSLGFEHPHTHREVRFEMQPPPDFADVLARLRARPA